MNDKLTALASHFGNCFLHYHNSGWSAGVEKAFAPGVEVKVRASGHPTAEDAVNDLFAKVQEVAQNTASLHALK